MAAAEPSAAVSPNAVRAQRDRILASRIFSRSKRQSAFLHYIVEQTLKGRGQELKEFTLGVDVFGKDESFDPSIDSIVRVEASRLRSKLIEYYVDEGQNDAVRVDIPKGHYVPMFTIANVAKRDRDAGRSPLLAIGVVVVAIAIAATYLLTRPSHPPSIPSAAAPAPAPAPAPERYSLAVLPLRDWSSSPEAYFSEAMTDALISSLTQVRSLRVTSLTSVMRFSDTEIPVPEIARVLDVAYIVEGSVIRDGDLVRITAQLIAANSDTHVWSKTFDRPAPDLLSAQSEIATEIAAQISDELLPEPMERVERVNPAAYEAYMKGRYFYNQFTADGFHRSMEHFQRAIDIEPEYAKAYAGLASCHCLLAGHGLEMVSPVIAIPESRALASKALRLNEDLAEPIAFLGIIKLKFDWDLESAEALLERSIRLNPSLFQAHIWHSQILEAKGLSDEAVSRARYAKRLNPLSLAAGLNLGWQLYQAGYYGEAGAEIDRLIEFNDAFWGGHWAKGHIFNQHGMYDKAIDEFQRAVELGGGHSLPMSALGYTYAVAGRSEEARQVIKELDALSREAYVSPFHVATVYAGLAERDRMYDWLERAFSVRARSVAWMHVSKEMQPYHEDARFKDLLNRIGIYKSQQAAF